MKKTIYLIIITVIFAIITFATANLFIKSFYFRNLTTNYQKQLIEKFFFPLRYLHNQKEKNFYSEKLKNELNFKKDLKDINFKEKKEIKLDNNLLLTKYTFLEGFYTGIEHTSPGSGYLSFYNNDLIIISVRGVLAYKPKNSIKIQFKQIKNNIESFINWKQFIKHKRFSIKDLHIYSNKIFVSYTEEIKKDCWNISVIYADFNYHNIIFKKLFSPTQCIHSEKNKDHEFNAMQSGGRIISLDTNHLVLSVGDFRSRYLAQDKTSVNGKLLKINIENHSYQIISMGHRNVQGLLFDEENKFLLATEHGPAGGDEINLIQLVNNDVPNYGWPTSSYGEHYSDRFNITRVNKYPLYKSHSAYGFVEPIKYFKGSIGPSEIVKISKNKYIFSSLAEKSIFFFDLDENKKMINLQKIKVGERIRDMIFKDKTIYLFLEDTASLGIIKF